MAPRAGRADTLRVLAWVVALAGVGRTIRKLPRVAAARTCFQPGLDQTWGSVQIYAHDRIINLDCFQASSFATYTADCKDEMKIRFDDCNFVSNKYHPIIIITFPLISRIRSNVFVMKDEVCLFRVTQHLV